MEKKWNLSSDSDVWEGLELCRGVQGGNWTVKGTTGSQEGTQIKFIPAKCGQNAACVY